MCGYGTYGPSGLVPCLECPKDSFSGPPPVDGFKQCTTCPEGTFTFQPGAQSVNQCRAKCEPGTYSDTGLAPCAPCPQNFFQPLEGKFFLCSFSPHLFEGATKNAKMKLQPAGPSTSILLGQYLDIFLILPVTVLQVRGRALSATQLRRPLELGRLPRTVAWT